MSYHGQHQHGQFAGSATTRPFTQHAQQPNSQIGLAQHTQQPPQQAQHPQQYAAHLQHHPSNSSFALGQLTAAGSYKLDSARDSRQNNGLPTYGNMSSGNWSAAEMAGFGQAHSGGQISHMLAQPHHSASQPSLPMSQYSQPPPQPQQQQPQPPQQQQQQQHQQQQQQTFIFSAHSQSPAHLRVMHRLSGYRHGCDICQRAFSTNWQGASFLSLS